MKWSEKHDIFLLFMKPISSRREAHKVDTNGKILRVTFAKKRRLPSVSTKSLSGIDTGCYQKKKKKRASEGSSGSNTDETELDQLLKSLSQIKKGTPRMKSKANQATPGKAPRRVDQTLCSTCRVKLRKSFLSVSGKNT